MSPELAMQLADTAGLLIDSGTDYLANKLRKPELLKKIRQQRELEEAYKERIWGEGQGGGFSTHLFDHDNNYFLKTFMPALGAAAQSWYQFGADSIEKGVNKLQEKKLAQAETSDDTKQSVPEDTIEAQGTPNQIAQNTGTTLMADPVGKTSNSLYIPGHSLNTLNSFGQKPSSGGFGGNMYSALYAKEGTKLVPRPK